MGNLSSNRNSSRQLKQSFSLKSISSILSKKSHVENNYINSGISESYIELTNEIVGPELKSIFSPEFQFRSDVCKSDFHFFGKIGKGTFGDVYCCSWQKKSNILVAVKIQCKKVIASKNAVKQITRETEIHKILDDCNFIAKYYDCWQTVTHLFTVMEYVDGGIDLYGLWTETVHFPEATIRIYAAEIALALDYLQCKNIINRDFKMENLALNYQKHIKLIDFGFAKILNSDEKATTICGTLQYMAPEVASGTPYSFSVDWWCFGVILYILSEKNYPFPNANADNHKSLVFDTPLTFQTTSSELAELIKKLLNLNQDSRLSSLIQIQKQPFFPSTFNFFETQNCPIELEDIPVVKQKQSSIFSGWI